MPLKGDVGVGVEPKPEPIAAAQVTDPAPVKSYLTTKTGIKAADISKQVWAKPADIIGNAVKAHGGTMENYRNSGLG